MAYKNDTFSEIEGERKAAHGSNSNSEWNGLLAAHGNGQRRVIRKLQSLN